MRHREAMKMKLKRYMEKSRRFLHKAKYLNVKNMEDCINMVGYGGGMACPTVYITRIPRSFSVAYSRVSDDEFKEACRTMNEAQLGDNRDHKYWQEKGSEDNIMGPKVLTRSYSICLGGLARIDEDRPCYFDDEPVCSMTITFGQKRNFI